MHKRIVSEMTGSLPMGGVVFDGIDNACLESTLRMLQIKSKHWPRVFWQIRVLEDEARKLAEDEELA